MKRSGAEKENMNWLTQNIGQFLGDLVGSAINVFGEWLNNIFYWIVKQATDNVYVTNAQKYIVGIAIGLISLMVIKIVMSGYLLETDYDSEEDPFNLLVRIVQVFAVITNAGWIFRYLLGISKEFTADMIGSSNFSYAEKTHSLLETTGVSIQIFLPLILLIILIAVWVFSVIAGLRGAELVAMNLFLPFFALDMLTNSRERWGNFFSAYLIAFFTYAFQIFFFTIAMKSYATITVDNPQYYISTLVWIILAIKTPKFLEKYLYKSGISNAASGGIRMVIQTAAMRGMRF